MEDGKFGKGNKRDDIEKKEMVDTSELKQYIKKYDQK